MRLGDPKVPLKRLHGIGDPSLVLGIQGFMHSTSGWPLVESLHFIGLSLLIGTVGLFDLRLLGLAKGIPFSALHRLVPWGITGYGLNVITGFMFVSSVPDQYLYNPVFRTKIALMAVAVSTSRASTDSCSARSRPAAPMPTHRGQQGLWPPFR